MCLLASISPILFERGIEFRVWGLSQGLWLRQVCESWRICEDSPGNQICCCAQVMVLEEAVENLLKVKFFCTLHSICFLLLLFSLLHAPFCLTFSFTPFKSFQVPRVPSSSSFFFPVLVFLHTSLSPSSHASLLLSSVSLSHPPSLCLHMLRIRIGFRGEQLWILS